MPGFASSLSNNIECVFANNADFSGSGEPSDLNGLQTNGQLWIGHTDLAPGALHIKVGKITSTSLTVGYSSPNITIETINNGIIKTIAGDTGTPITGENVTIFANQADLNCGSTVFFNNDGITTSTFNVTNSFLSTIVGQLAGTATETGGFNTGLGYAVLSAISTGGFNTGLGYGSLTPLTTGNSNTAIGVSSLGALTEGVFNQVLGASAGISYTTTESGNICISNVGVIGESHTIRLGTQGNTDLGPTGQQDRCFIAGIVGITVANTQLVTIDSLTGQLGVKAVPADGILTLSDNSDVKVSPDGTGNIKLEGQLNEQVTPFSTTVSDGAGFLIKINPMSGSRWIVDPLSTAANPNGTHTTIASAINVATANDVILIMPGTYTENLTLKAGVNLVGLGDASYNTVNPVIISGNTTFTAAGTVSITGIQLQTNSGFLLSVTGTLASVVTLNNCYLNCLNSSGISFTTSSASAQIIIQNCSGNLGTTGINLFTHSSAGTLTIKNFNFTNSGGSSTANTISAGTLLIQYSKISNPITSSGTSAISLRFLDLDTSAQNVTALTCGGSGLNGGNYCTFSGGTASAISSSSVWNMVYCAISSSNTNAVTGAGQVISNAITYTGSSITNNATTQTGSGVIIGLRNGVSPAVGMIGERISSTVLSSSPVAMGGSNVATSITSIDLTPGVWDVSALGGMGLNGATVQNFKVAINSSVAVPAAQGDSLIYGFVGTAGLSDCGGSIPQFRVTLSATTTYYLILASQYSVATPNGYGRITATRVG